MHTVYYPEMGEQRPQDSEIDAWVGHYGGWFVQTNLTLKGMGITYLRTLVSSDLVNTPEAQAKVGRHEYKVTDRAFRALEKRYKISTECLL